MLNRLDKRSGNDTLSKFCHPSLFYLYISNHFALHSQMQYAYNYTFIIKHNSNAQIIISMCLNSNDKRQVIGIQQRTVDLHCDWIICMCQNLNYYTVPLEWNLTLLETSLTFPEASATAVSAMTSALMEPRPPVALVLIKLSSTTSSRSVICKQLGL